MNIYGDGRDLVVTEEQAAKLRELGYIQPCMDGESEHMDLKPRSRKMQDLIDALADGTLLPPERPIVSD
jgi:predicted ABC-class ATPase